MQFMGRDRKMAWHSNQGAIGSPHELGAKSGSKLPALQTLARQGSVPEYREAFGVRPACRRFRWFMVPMRGNQAMEASHEARSSRREEAHSSRTSGYQSLLTSAATAPGFN